MKRKTLATLATVILASAATAVGAQSANAAEEGKYDARLAPRTAHSASLPLDDPWIMFCLLNEEPKDVGDCIDGLPSPARNALRQAGLRPIYEVWFEAVPADTQDREPRSALICPHEFDAACAHLIEAVLALGGTCSNQDRNTVCQLP